MKAPTSTCADEYGNTALTEATYYGHASVIKELLMRGADVNVISNDGTPLGHRGQAETTLR